MEKIAYYAVSLTRLMLEIIGSIVFGVLAANIIGPHVPKLPKIFYFQALSPEGMFVGMLAVMAVYKVIGCKGLVTLVSNSNLVKS